MPGGGTLFHYCHSKLSSWSPRVISRSRLGIPDLLRRNRRSCLLFTAATTVSPSQGCSRAPRCPTGTPSTRHDASAHKTPSLKCSSRVQRLRRCWYLRGASSALVVAWRRMPEDQYTAALSKSWYYLFSIYFAQQYRQQFSVIRSSGRWAYCGGWQK